MGILTEQTQMMKSSDDASMERSKSFITALQELKNLRPQMCSAAEYCEKSYLRSEQKQTVLENLKDYAIRALVNAIDHIGTVAYKFNEVIEQQTLEISSVDLKVTCLNQKLLTCQTYTDKEGLRQQQLLAIIPRHHKHYILPNSINKKVPISPLVQKDPTQPVRNKPPLYPSVASASKTLSWHLASETKSTMKGSPRGIMSVDDSKTDRNRNIISENKRMKSTPATRVAMQTLGVTRRKSVDGSKALSSVDNVRNVKEDVENYKSNVLSSLFAKQRKLKS